jgi:hypothetical protein
MLSLLVHKALLFLHRPWFAKILREANSEPLLSPNATSFTACITSSRRHTRIMKSILQYAPTLAHTWWFFAFHVSFLMQHFFFFKLLTFPGRPSHRQVGVSRPYKVGSCTDCVIAVIQALVVIRAPASMICTEVTRDFQLTYSLFESMGEKSPTARRALPALRNLYQRAFRGMSESEKSEDDIALLGTSTRITRLQKPTGTPSPKVPLQSPLPLPTSNAGRQIDQEPGDLDVSLDPSLGLERMDVGALLSVLELPVEFQRSNEWAIHDPLLHSMLYWHPDPSNNM